MKNQRILLISSRPLEHSGMTKVMLDIIRYNQDILSFDVACGFAFEDEYTARLRAMGSEPIRLPDKARVFSYMRGIRKLVGERAYEKVYIHGNSAIMLLEALPAHLAGAEVLTHCHNTRAGKSQLLYTLIRPLFSRVVDIKIGCSGQACAWAYRGKHVLTIPNGIDPDRFRPDPDVRNRQRRKLGWEGKKILGHIGTFNTQKNQNRLVDIFRDLRKEDENWALLMLGDGEKEMEVRNKVETLCLADSVKILPFTANPESFMQAMDVMALPSLFEGFCLVALEAQACGVPVVVSDAVPEEALLEGRYSRLSLKEENEKWVRAIRSAAKTADRSGAKETILENGLDFNQMMRKIRTVLVRGTENGC